MARAEDQASGTARNGQLMPRAYSIDLRERVLAACEAGMASRVVAQQYRVSRAWTTDGW